MEVEGGLAGVRWRSREAQLGSGGGRGESRLRSGEGEHGSEHIKGEARAMTRGGGA